MAKQIVLIIGLLLLTACAGQENPVALQTIDNPELNDPASGPTTLYRAVIAQGVPSKVAKKAFEKYDQFSGQVRNPAYITMIDFTQHSGSKRFYMVNRTTGKVDRWTVAHGEASDPDEDGYAQYFSNVPNSHMSSLGSYLIQEKYQGKHGDSLKLDGLEGTNSNVRDRAIVIHPAAYVADSNAAQGFSWGCPAIPFAWIQTVIARARDGGFMYAYGINQRSAAADMDTLRQWDLIPKSMWPSEE